MNTSIKSKCKVPSSSDYEIFEQNSGSIEVDEFFAFFGLGVLVFLSGPAFWARMLKRTPPSDEQPDAPAMNPGKMEPTLPFRGFFPGASCRIAG